MTSRKTDALTHPDLNAQSLDAKVPLGQARYFIPYSTKDTARSHRHRAPRTARLSISTAVQCATMRNKSRLSRRARKTASPQGASPEPHKPCYRFPGQRRPTSSAARRQQTTSASYFTELSEISAPWTRRSDIATLAQNPQQLKKNYVFHRQSRTKNTSHTRVTSDFTQVCCVIAALHRSSVESVAPAARVI